jgi:flagellar biosynthesis/type III secretory pathway chaperone
MTALAAPGADVAEIAGFLSELSQVQTELLDLLRAKQKHLASKGADGLDVLLEREQQLAERLQACHDRRADLLKRAGGDGAAEESIEALTATLDAAERRPLQRQMQEAASRMRILQHQSLVNWVLAQRALLHVAQVLEIIATGGRMQPTYGSGANPTSRGNLLNGEA